MNSLKQVAAFMEYVLRPMSDDIKTIISDLKDLDLPLTEDLIRQIVKTCLATHIILELIKWAVYVTVTWMVCQTVIKVFPCL